MKTNALRKIQRTFSNWVGGQGQPSPGRRKTARVLLPGMLLLLAIWGLSTGCSLTNRLKSMRVAATDTPQVDLTQSYEQVQGTLESLATQTAQAVQPSPTLFVASPFPTFTPTQPAPTATQPSPTETETPPPVASFATSTPETPAGKIRFDAGQTSAYVQKRIRSGEQHLYRVRALQGQTLVLSASSPEADVYLAVKGLTDGQVLLSAASQATDWSGRLPADQEYQVSLTTSNPNTYYFLAIEVPANIYFDAGAYADTVDGYVLVDENFHPEVLTRVRYRARAFAGQTMTVELNSPHLQDLSVGVVGETDGEVYLRYEVKNSGGSFVLLADQAYFIDVYAVNGVSTSFTLKLTIR